MNSINPIYNSNIIYTPHFKSNEGHSSVTQPIIAENSDFFKGSEAMANYNLGSIDKSKIDIPEIKLPYVERDINQIEGEKVYNSDGELVRIIDENSEYKKDYDIRDNQVYICRYSDKHTGELTEVEFGDSFITVWKNLPNGEELCSEYDENGKLTYKSQNINGTYKSYDVSSKQYLVNQRQNNKEYNVFLDENKDYVSEEILGDKKLARVNFYNNKPYVVNIDNKKYIPNKLDDELLVRTKIEPASFVQYKVGDIEKLDGVKKYYSNGQLEEVITQDGTKYSIDFDQNNIEINDGNKITRVNTDKYRTMTSIFEHLPDGSKRMTKYSTNIPGYSVDLYKDNSHKYLNYSEDSGKYAYEEYIDDKVSCVLSYDREGNILDYDNFNDKK